MLQIGTLKAMQMYFVGSEHTEHISSLDFVNVAAMTKKSELWVQPCFKNIAIIYALDTAHEKYGVWRLFFQIIILPTGTVHVTFSKL